jgi:predicted pyridoxine 5'-phosphate oxidase superfamily flavin-nucleotide-binding protein
MSSTFHEGELSVQHRAGVEDLAARLGGMLATPSLDGGIGRFLAAQSFAALTGRDHDGRLWISPLVAAPGFLDAAGQHLTIRTGLPATDPLHELPVGQPVGLIVIDLGRRRRVRVNGTLVAAGPAGLEVDVDQAYGNCPQYIQQRRLDPADERARAGAGQARWATSLTDTHREMLRRTDTMFVGTVHPRGGADASHRGGGRGFVRVEGDRLWWPDYPGNNMFNTLGNIAVDDNTALLVVDFDRGTSLHLSGHASIEWTPPGTAGDDGHTGRRVWFTPNWVVETDGLPLHAQGGVLASPANPPVAPAQPSGRS